MNDKSLRSYFPNYNIPKVELDAVEKLSYEVKLKIAVEHLSHFADFHVIIRKLEVIKEEDSINNDPVLNFLRELKKANEGKNETK